MVQATVEQSALQPHAVAAKQAGKIGSSQACAVRSGKNSRAA
jgi:hypothetical protein